MSRISSFRPASPNREAPPRCPTLTRPWASRPRAPAGGAAVARTIIPTRRLGRTLWGWRSRDGDRRRRGTASVPGPVPCPWRPTRGTWSWMPSAWLSPSSRHNLTRRPRDEKHTWGGRARGNPAAALQWMPSLSASWSRGRPRGVSPLPPPHEPAPCSSLASSYLLANVVLTADLGGGRDANLNMKAAFLEVANDASAPSR